LSAGAFDDPRGRLVHEDGAAYVAYRPAGSFDAVIVDGGDYTGLSAVLFSASFFSDIARVLRPGGVMALQTGSVLDAHLIRNGREQLGAVFADVTVYRLTVPSYHCGEYCFLAAALSPILSDPDPVQLAQVEAALRSRFTPAYWSPAVQRAAQVLPATFP
jgi:spermidine synthase